MNVLDCRFEASGDKGISVGEASEVLVRDCHIGRCSIGVEVKDGSRLVVVNTTCDGNQRGYHSYRKKWLYPNGGFGLLVDCTFRDGREATLDLESKSKVWLLRTPVHYVNAGKNRVHKIESMDPQWKQMIEELKALCASQGGVGSCAHGRNDVKFEIMQSHRMS